MLSRQFLLDFKRATEGKWKTQELNPHIYGFQFQAGTCWNPGLTNTEISMYQEEVKVVFSDDFREFLTVMNGTDLPTRNIYGNSGEPPCDSVGVYSYPRDVHIVMSMIANVDANRDRLTETLAGEGFVLSANGKLMPIFSHRYVVCDCPNGPSPVLSICDSEDAIVYGHSLQEYLKREFLKS
jgi:hypothetical protein